jgi:hypothetical protein
VSCSILVITGTHQLTFIRPKRLGQHNVIDLSKPNVDGLITSESAQIIPTTILRNENVGYTKGRNVGMTSGWLAYTMSKGERSSHITCEDLADLSRTSTLD